MNAADFFTQADRLPLRSRSEILGDGGVIIVAPHPDDESLGCGGLSAACVEEGRSVRVVIVSDGAGSHANSKRFPHDVLRDLREGEARTACAALGLSAEPLFLRLPDGAVPQSGVDSDAAVEAIVTLAERTHARTILVTWRHDPHCDHVASATLAERAAEQISGVKLLEYPVWGHTLPPTHIVGDAPRGFRLHIGDVLDRKRAAIAAHRSQITHMIDDDPDGFMLAPDMIARFLRPFEIFLEAP